VPLINYRIASGKTSLLLYWLSDCPVRRSRRTTSSEDDVGEPPRLKSLFLIRFVFFVTLRMSNKA
jgi:hypothetical protein